MGYSSGSETHDPMAYDLLALGETMLALSPAPGETLARAWSLLLDHAGAESNACVGLARLGFNVGWISRLGADAAGERILAALQAEGVDTRFVRRDAGRPTGLLLKEPGAGVRYYRTGSAASEISPDDLSDVPVAEARAVLVTGVTALIGPRSLAAALAFLAAARGLRVVDPNLRSGLWGSERRAALVGSLLERCDVLLGGEDELRELAGDGGDLRSLAEHCAARGPAEVVVRGQDRLAALSADGQWLEIEDERRAGAVDPVGAGDAFNAGYIAARLRGWPVSEALRVGALCGRAVAQALGDTAGFPNALSFEAWARALASSSR
jgi:2-dehydro-3-deoxygluconokinase